MAAARRRVPVLIVGGGPVGLYASSLLSSYGVPSLLVERSAQPSTHPRAHLINTRSMELLRELGVEPQVRAQTPPMSEWRHFRYCSTLLGEQIAAQDHMAGSTWAQLQAASPTEMQHLSQPKLAAILRAEATRRAAESGASLLCGYECTLIDQDGTGVRAELRRRPRGGGAGAQAEAAAEVVHVEAEDVLGCDGAHSSVRRWLGLPMQGPPPLQHFKSVHFTAPDLWPRLRDADQAALALTRTVALALALALTLTITLALALTLTLTLTLTVIVTVTLTLTLTLTLSLSLSLSLRLTRRRCCTSPSTRTRWRSSSRTTCSRASGLRSSPSSQASRATPRWRSARAPPPSARASAAR